MITKIMLHQFDTAVLVQKCDGQEEALRRFYEYKKLGAMLEGHEDTVVGWCQAYKGDIYIWYNDDRVLVHELVHAAFILCEILGIAVDEEFIAYTTQYLHRELQ